MPIEDDLNSDSHIGDGPEHSLKNAMADLRSPNNHRFSSYFTLASSAFSALFGRYGCNCRHLFPI